MERTAEKQLACLETTSVTRPLTAIELADPVQIKPEPAPIVDRRVVNDCGEVVSLEKGYFSGHPTTQGWQTRKHPHRKPTRWHKLLDKMKAWLS
jgi:hypothetical protein